jgi:hypothetical protein
VCRRERIQNEPKGTNSQTRPISGGNSDDSSAAVTAALRGKDFDMGLKSILPIPCTETDTKTRAMVTGITGRTEANNTKNRDKPKLSL